ncbi:acyltransferase [Rhodoferax lacus]|uniref:Acyltransferase n=1 Tax=Rhodoferax lacus TaxID=2184758 RepID=A0A3E1R9B9_9BURK|nr:acyltransferase [Rhodoferax lacus]RFO95811.1 acyltransferase [Rhodoferax lacus]
MAGSGASLNLLANGRDNNLNLLRIVAATAVLISHSFVLATGDSDTEPLVRWIGMSLGELAVCAFFVASGFLVTASICKSRDPLDFIVARCLRIFPALLVLILITVFVVGPIVTTTSIGDYFGFQAGVYLVKCVTLLGGVSTKLTGVFEANPYKAAVNGSLWTLPWELRCYVVLLMLWGVAKGLRKFRLRLRWGGSGEAFLALTAGSGFVLYCVWLDLSRTNAHAAHSVLAVTMFAMGSMMWQLRSRIFLSWYGAILALTSLCVAQLLSLSVFRVLLPFALAYVVMYFAFVPRGVFRKYNLVGDYSYGMYLYAFPIQQMLAMAWQGIKPIEMVAVSFLCTLLCAIPSWRWIEKNAVRTKVQIMGRIRPLPHQSAVGNV